MNRRDKCVNYQPCKTMPLALAGAALLSLCMLCWGCGSQQAAQEAQPAQAAGGGGGGQGRGRGGRGGGGQAIPVVAEKAVLKNMPIDVTAIGTVEAYLTVSIRPQVTGPLLEARFKEGDFVRKDQVLFKIDPRPYEASLAQAKAALARDKALAANNRSQAERYKKLLAEGVVAAQQVDQFLSAADASDATVTADEAAIQTSELNLDYCTITASLDGYTGKLMVQPGNFVRVADPLVVINQVTPVYVTFSVPQQHLGDIKQYMANGKLAVTAALPNDTAAPERGTLEFVDNAVDPSTGTIRLRAQFDNQRKRLWPGLFVNTMLRLSERPNTLVVPSQAISTNQTGQYVYVVKSDGTVESRPIVTGIAIEGQTIIEQGLKAGETVVTDGQLRLVPGSRAEITNRGAGDTPAPPAGGSGANRTGGDAGGAAPAAAAGSANAGTGAGQRQGRGQGRRGGQGQGQ
jgi:membrane fusion protein, multidrug efflux system